LLFLLLLDVVFTISILAWLSTFGHCDSGAYALDGGFQGDERDLGLVCDAGEEGILVSGDKNCRTDRLI
jgi:hypothetical protein